MNQDNQQPAPAPQQQPTQLPPQAANVAPQPPVQAQPAPVQQPAPQKTIDVKFEDDLVLQVTAEKVDDMRFMELYAAVNDDYMQLAKLLRFMFGSEQFDKVYEYYESKGQTFSMTKMETVFEKFNQDMNSNPDFLRR